MPSINMIAARRAEKKRIEKFVYITLMVIAGEAALVLGTLGFMTAKVHAAGSHIKQLDAQMIRVQPTVERIQSYESEIKDLKPRLDLLESSRKSTLTWYVIMHDLARSMPEKTWLTSVSTQVVQPSAADVLQTPSATISIGGNSISQKLVGETMLRLNECPEFDRVDLTYTQEAGGTLKALQFMISAKLGSEPQKGGAENAKN